VLVMAARFHRRFECHLVTRPTSMVTGGVCDPATGQTAAATVDRSNLTCIGACRDIHTDSASGLQAHHDMFGFGDHRNGSWRCRRKCHSDRLQLGVGHTPAMVFAHVNRDVEEHDVTAAGGGDACKGNAFSIGAKWNVATGYVGGQFIKARTELSGNMAA
jgi:hypothetical protein